MKQSGIRAPTSQGKDKGRPSPPPRHLTINAAQPKNITSHVTSAGTLHKQEEQGHSLKENAFDRLGNGQLFSPQLKVLCVTTTTPHNKKLINPAFEATRSPKSQRNDKTEDGPDLQRANALSKKPTGQKAKQLLQKTSAHGSSSPFSVLLSKKKGETSNNSLIDKNSGKTSDNVMFFTSKFRQTSLQKSLFEDDSTTRMLDGPFNNLSHTNILNLTTLARRNTHNHDSCSQTLASFADTKTIRHNTLTRRRAIDGKNHGPAKRVQINMVDQIPQEMVASLLKPLLVDKQSTKTLGQQGKRHQKVNKGKGDTTALEKSGSVNKTTTGNGKKPQDKNNITFLDDMTEITKARHVKIPTETSLSTIIHIHSGNAAGNDGNIIASPCHKIAGKDSKGEQTPNSTVLEGTLNFTSAKGKRTKSNSKNPAARAGFHNDTFEPGGKKRSENNAKDSQHHQNIPPPNASLSDYAYGQLIGRGAFAIVREGLHKPTSRKVAIKMYDKLNVKHLMRTKNLKEEIKILRLLNHPNIIRLFDYFSTKTFASLILEFVDGVSLASYLKEKPQYRLDEDEARAIFRQIVSAVAYCHKYGVAHRDIKLDNILITKDGVIKLIDFGLSTTNPTDQKSRLFCGTPSYMAPEIIKKKEYYGAHADVWALGVVLFVLLCGCFPFKGSSDKDLFHRIVKCEYSSSLLPEGAANLLKRIFNMDPEKRPQSQEILDDPWVKEIRSPSKQVEKELLSEGKEFNDIGVLGEPNPKRVEGPEEEKATEPQAPAWFQIEDNAAIEKYKAQIKEEIVSQLVNMGYDKEYIGYKLKDETSHVASLFTKIFNNKLRQFLLKENKE